MKAKNSFTKGVFELFTLKVDEEIQLQLFQIQHSEELFRLVDENRHYLRAWLPWVDGITSPIQYHSIIPMWLRQFAENEGFSAGIRYRGQLVGSIGLHSVDWYNRQISLGYFLAQNAVGKGIMTRSVYAVINHAFMELIFNRIEVRCGEKNLKSRAIPERLGFTMEGKIRQGENLYGFYHDLIIYSLLADEWKGRIHLVKRA